MSILRRILLAALVLGILAQGLLTCQAANLYGEGRPRLVTFGMVIFALDIAYVVCLLLMFRLAKISLILQFAIFGGMVCLGALYLGGNWAQILYTHWLLVPASLAVYAINQKVQVQAVNA